MTKKEIKNAINKAVYQYAESLGYQMSDDNDGSYVTFYKFESDACDDMIDYTKWEMVDRIGNVFNRCVMYRADNYHVSLDYFGKNMYDGRLFQVFFFNTER